MSFDMGTEIKKVVENTSAILFDMDGTLFDTELIHAKALSIALEKMKNKISIEELHHRFYGKTDISIFLELFPDQFKTEYQNFQKEKNLIVIELFNNLDSEQKNKLTAKGIKTFLQYLRRSGKKLALVSSSEKEIVDVTLKTFGATLFFDTIIGRSGTYFNKPNPSPYFKAMRFLKIPNNKAIIFEDSPSGLQSAVATGCQVIKASCFDRGEMTTDYLQTIIGKEKKLLQIDNYLDCFVTQNTTQNSF